MNVLDAILTRRSIRKFTPQPVSEADIATMLRAAMAAPSARNAQPWHFIVVRDRAILDAIAEFNPYAQMVKHAPLAVAVCAALDEEKAPGYWQQDCAAALQNLMLAARGLGIGTVWTGVYPREERVEGAKKLFHLPENVMPLGVVVVGHPDQPFSEADRFNEAKIHYDRW